MTQKIIPAIEKFLDEAEEYRYAFFVNCVEAAWDEMQTLNKVNVGAIRTALEQAKKEKDTIRYNFDKARCELERTYNNIKRPLMEPAWARGKEQDPESHFGWNFWDYCTPEEKKAVKQIEREETAKIKQLKEDMGLDKALAEVRDLTTLLKTQKELEKQQKDFWKRYPMLAGGLIFYCTDMNEALKWCKRESRLFREGIKADIFARTRAYIGEMYDMEPTKLNAKLNLNGIAYGEKGACKVWTIIAGGYNIQKEHYRCLVHKI